MVIKKPSLKKLLCLHYDMLDACKWKYYINVNRQLNVKTWNTLDYYYCNKDK